MARSMTAYASAEATSELGQLRLELRSVNHRFLELGFKLPEELRALEPKLRERIQKVAQRGKIDLSLRFRASPQSHELALNEPLVDGLLALAERLHNQRPELAPLSTANVLAWPGAVQSNELDSEALRSQVLQVLEQALREFEQARSREGNQLAELLGQRVRAIEALRAQALTLGPQIRAALGEKLRVRMAEFQATLDANRLEAELVMQLQKLDVDEELERLAIHLIEAERVLQLSEPIGRRLDFLIQELHREANTFGAKSVDARTSQIGVDMKVLIEQVREQVQNLE